MDDLLASIRKIMADEGGDEAPVHAPDRGPRRDAPPRVGTGDPMTRMERAMKRAFDPHLEAAREALFVAEARLAEAPPVFEQHEVDEASHTAAPAPHRTAREPEAPPAPVAPQPRAARLEDPLTRTADRWGPQVLAEPDLLDDDLDQFAEPQTEYRAVDDHHASEPQAEAFDAEDLHDDDDTDYEEVEVAAQDDVSPDVPEPAAAQCEPQVQAQQVDEDADDIEWDDAEDEPADEELHAAADAQPVDEPMPDAPQQQAEPQPAPAPAAAQESDAPTQEPVAAGADDGESLRDETARRCEAAIAEAFGRDDADDPAPRPLAALKSRLEARAQARPDTAAVDHAARRSAMWEAAKTMRPSGRAWPRAHAPAGEPPLSTAPRSDMPATPQREERPVRDSRLRLQPEEPRAPAFAEAALWAAQPARSVFTPATPDPAWTEAGAAPAAQAATPEESLISQQTRRAVSDSFEQLSRTVLNTNPRTFEDLLTDMMRPMLREWLDTHLPNIVERHVRAEIERVMRHGR